MMGLGMMIGAGVFLGMGISIGRAGPGGLLLTFGLNGLLAMLTAMSFAELSSAIPKAGGVYNFARIAFGRGTSFLAGWMEWFASSVAGSMYALTFAIYTIRFFETIGWFNPIFAAMPGYPPEQIILFMEKVLAVGTAMLFIYINFKGSSETGKIGAIITMGQIIFVITIGIFGIFAVIKDPSRMQNFVPFIPNGWSKILITMGFTYVAFEGYEVIAQAGDEAINPRKNLPKAMIYSVVIVTCIYILVAFATVVSVSAATPGVDKAPWMWIGQYNEKGFGEAVTKLMPFGNFILTLAVIFSSTSALNATIYSATRASYALGRDAMMPSFFAKIHKKNKTPYGALLATSVIILLVATALPTADVASSASIMFLFLFFLVNLCVIKIRRNMSDELQYGFMLPFFPIPPIAAIICQIVLAVWLIHMSLIAWIIAPIWIAVGLGTYFFYARKRATTAEHEIQVIEEDIRHETGKYNVMVAVANPTNATKLIQGTYHICGAKDAQVELIHMVSLPDQIPLEDLGKFVTPAKEALMEVMLRLSAYFPINTTIRYCRNIARGIVSAVKEKKTNMLVLGWHGKPSTRIFNIGSTIDPIIEQAPCDVVVLKDCGGNKKFNKIIVPIAGGPNAAMAMEIASIVAEDNCKITVITIDNGRRQFDLEAFVKQTSEKLNLPTDTFETKTIKSKSAVLGILRTVKNYDLVVMGTTNKPLLSQLMRASLPEKIARRCNKSMIITKSGQGMSSWIKRWI
jgi:amino acid transporter/nucleotide-binding universal stress UspA family protein